MSIQITTILNDGFDWNEIEFLTREFIIAASRLRLNVNLVEKNGWVEEIELDASGIILIITLKIIYGCRQLEGKVFIKKNALRIVAIEI